MEAQAQVGDVLLLHLQDAVHLLDEPVVLLEDLQLVVGVVALQYVDLHAHAQDHSHLAEVDHL